MERKGRGRHIDPEAALAGRVQLDAVELVELIRRVNPTDRGLDKPETLRRYALKQRLQSLLVRSFRDELELVQDAAREGLVTLVHRPSRRDACHAVVAELDDDARAWVQRLLDERQAPAVGGEATNAKAAREPRAEAGSIEGDDEDLDGLSVSQLVERGRMAAVSYDFDRAQSLFRLGLARSRGAAEASFPLLELLVDQLGAFHEAHALGTSLSREALADGRVRLLLGLAAAHSGEPLTAQRYVEGLEDPRLVEVYTILAAAALAAGDDQTATQHLTRAERLGCPSPDLLRLGAELAEHRAARYRDAEAEIEALLAGGHMTDAERAARALLDRYAESKVARKVLTCVGQQRREERCKALLAEGETALSTGAAGAAVKLFKEALAAGADRDLVVPRLDIAQALEREDEARSQVEAVLRLMAGPERRAALLGYLALDADLRARVRAANESPLFAWLEETGARTSGSAARSAVDAVLALEQGRAAFSTGNLEQGRSQVEPHRAALAAIADGRRLLAEVDAQALAERRERSRDLVQQMEAALAADDLPSALRLLEQVDRRLLEDGELAGLDARLEAARGAESIRELARRVESALAAGDPQAARALVEELVSRTAGEEQLSWRRREDDIAAELRRRWRLEVVEGDGLPGIPLHLHGSRGGEEASLWLDARGQHLYAVTSRSDRLFIQVIDATSSRVECSVVLRMPQALSRFGLDALVDGDVLTVTSGVRLLRVRLGTWDVLSWEVVDPLLSTGARVDDVDAVPGSRHAWITVYAGQQSRLLVYDCDRGRVRRELRAFYSPTLVCGGKEPLMIFCAGEDRSPVVYETRGVPHRLKLPRDLCLSGAAIHPDGERLALLFTEGDGTERHTGPLSLTVLPRDGETAKPLRVDNSDGELLHGIGTSRDAGLVFITYHSAGTEGVFLVAVRSTPTEHQLLYRVPIPRDAVLAQDAAARKLALVFASDSGVGVTLLGEEQPSFPPGREWAHQVLRFKRQYCGPEPEEDDSAIEELADELRSLALPAADARVEREREALSADPDGLLRLYHALGRTLHPPRLTEELAAFAWERHPQHPLLALAHADHLSEADDWPAVRHVLEAVPVQGLDPEPAQHWHHLLGMALYLEGEVEVAGRHWEAGLLLDGDCELEPYLELVSPFPEPLRPEDWGPDQPIIRQLRGAIQTADLLLAEGQWEAVIRTLHRPATWQSEEVQSLARLAVAHLQVEARTPAERHTKIFSLAAYLQAHAEERDMRAELPVPGATWDRGRLDDLAQRARQWLDEDGHHE